MPSASAEPPVFLIVAGPNGSDKSTAYQTADVEVFARSVWIINPDLLTERIRSVEKLPLADANLQAVKRIETWLDASLDAHQSVGVETVLSTDKYRRLVLKAKDLRFEIHLIYVVLDSVRRNIERVRLRVKKGGHNVPLNKIVERHRRSLDQLPWFLKQADRAWVYDNSGAIPKLIAQKDDSMIAIRRDALPDIIEAVNAVHTTA